MTLSPAILALMLVSVLQAACSVYAAIRGLQLLGGWDAGSSTSAQLGRERLSTLLSTLVGFVTFSELICLIFFVTLVDRLHDLFTGAMCAAGTLNANVYGYAALITMLAGFVTSGLWLMLNHLDNLPPPFQCIRLKHLSLVPISLLFSLQAFLLVNYFLGLNPTIITSCCATFFSAAGSGFGSNLAHLSPTVMQPIFWGTLVVTMAIGALSFRTARLDPIYAGLSTVLLPVGLGSIISFISVRIYELPTHHCPFCLFQGGYGYIGYWMYAGLFGGTVLGTGVGLGSWPIGSGHPCGRGGRFVRKLKIWSLAGYALLGLIAVEPLLFSDFKL